MVSSTSEQGPFAFSLIQYFPLGGHQLTWLSFMCLQDLPGYLLELPIDDRSLEEVMRINMDVKRY